MTMHQAEGLGGKDYLIPETEEEFTACLASWEWRIFSGQIYHIRLKSPTASDDDEDDPGIVAPFIPNKHQTSLLEQLHTRNLILKARQLGFSTLLQIMALDHAMFNPNQSVLIIADTVPSAKKLMRDKIKFAYRLMPQHIKDRVPIRTDNTMELIFENDSTIEVSASGRGGTFQFVHVSELGKISAKRPEAAREIVTGTLQAASNDAFVFLESTAEGLGGTFHDMSNKAQAAFQADKSLTKADYAFRFYAWWGEDSYRLDPVHVVISAADHKYFDLVEVKMDVALDLDQRAWYVAKRENDFSHNPHDMLREYPSTPEECWQASTEGKYFALNLAQARREGRIGAFPMIKYVPVNSFWDLGASDDTVVWLHQEINGMDRWVGYREGSGEGYLPFVLWMERLGYTMGTNYLPHDAKNHKQTETTVTSPLKILTEMKPSWDWAVVPRVQDLQWGIELTRKDFQTYCFDETATKEGLKHLEAYTREWNNRLGTWHDYPRHDRASNAADSLRQKAQGYIATPIGKAPKKKPRRVTGMTA